VNAKSTKGDKPKKKQADEIEYSKVETSSEEDESSESEESGEDNHESEAVFGHHYKGFQHESSKPVFGQPSKPVFSQSSESDALTKLILQNLSWD
jgi:hypothetical protein